MQDCKLYKLQGYLCFYFRVTEYDIIQQKENITLPLNVNSDDVNSWLVKKTWVYALIIVAATVFLLVANSLFALLISLASRNMHNDMFKKVLRAPAVFFDTRPVGRY